MKLAWTWVMFAQDAIADRQRESVACPHNARMAPVRCFFAAMPPPATLACLEQALQGCLALRGQALDEHRQFVPSNWHQSLSVVFDDAQALLPQLLRAGQLVQAKAFTLTLNRLRHTGSATDRALHWSFRAEGKEEAFFALRDELARALACEGLITQPNNQPHITVSYQAPGPLKRLACGQAEMQRVHWRVDRLLLVQALHDPYRYRPLAEWQLGSAPPGPESQISLF